MISAIVYGDGETTEYDDLAAARDAVGTTWVHATEVTDAELDTIATEFDIHGLAIDDLGNDIRAKTEEFPDHTFVLFKTATLARGETTFRKRSPPHRSGSFSVRTGSSPSRRTTRRSSNASGRPSPPATSACSTAAPPSPPTGSSTSSSTTTSTCWTGSKTRSRPSRKTS